MTVILLILGTFSGCGSSNTDSSGDTTGTEEQTSENASEEEENRTGLLLETAKDGRIDFTVLQEENPEIWGWLYIPGTDIDRPLLQSATSDIRIIRQTDRKERRELFISKFPIRQTSVISIP